MRKLMGLVLMVATGVAGAEVATRSVEYSADGLDLHGYIAWDDAVEGPRPGVLVVHEWWGQNEYPRQRARMLAQMGYTAMALDMYGEGRTAEHPDEAGQFAGAVGQAADGGRGRFLAALEVLRNDPHTDPERIAAIGYCFGGGVVLQMARDGVDLAGVASFHGGLAAPAPAEPGAVQARVLVLHGAADPLVPPEQVEAFKAEMEAAGADYRFIAYPGAKHGFTNPEADANAERFSMAALGYDAEADRASWSELEAFLSEVFAP